MVVEYLAIKLRATRHIDKLVIRGVTVEPEQFSDDLTLILPRNEKSIEGAIGVLNDFARTSGLRVNFDKTNAIHIGNNTDAPPLCPALGLAWTDVFRLLGINFDNKLEKMEDNFSEPIVEVEALLESWRRRTTTPLGRLVVIKTLVLSKFTHFPVVLPNASGRFIAKLNGVLLKFVWGSM